MVMRGFESVCWERIFDSRDSLVDHDFVCEMPAQLENLNSWKVECKIRKLSRTYRRGPCDVWLKPAATCPLSPLWALGERMRT